MKFRSVNLMVWFLLVQVFIIGGVMAQASQCDANRDYLSQAQTAFEQAEYTVAVQAYSCALEHDPANPTLHIERIDSAVRAGDYMTA